jgi:hypothetical protein
MCEQRVYYYPSCRHLRRSSKAKPCNDALSKKRYCMKIKKRVAEIKGVCPGCVDKANKKLARKATKKAESDLTNYQAEQTETPATEQAQIERMARMMGTKYDSSANTSSSDRGSSLAAERIPQPLNDTPCPYVHDEEENEEIEELDEEQF